MQRILPTSQSFSKLRRGGYVYVDKTMYIPSLFEVGDAVFITRPRR